MDQNKLEALLSKLSGNGLSVSDREVLMEYLADPSNKASVQEAISRIMLQNTTAKHLLPQESSDEIVAAILATESEEQQGIVRSLPSRKTNYRWWWVAAAAIFAAAAYSMWHIIMPTTPASPVVQVTDRNPASLGAVLTLADGATIQLDTLKDGIITTPDGVNVRIRDGHLHAGQTPANAGSWNKVSTPDGRQYMMVLADGSKAWLNAGSTLEYSGSFTSSERTVRITGEVYFEVASKPEQPFKVNVKGMEIQVLGTAFNVNAYDDETTINTTLASGSVKISSDGITPAVLKPGQQARYQPSAPLKILPSVDLDKILAWKNGYFSFDDLSLQQVMKLIERWYDVDVKYEGPIPVEQYEGMVSRNMKLSGIIKALKDMDIDARLEGTTLIISKKKP